MRRAEIIVQENVSTSLESWHEALLLLEVARAVESDVLVTERASTLLSREQVTSPYEFILNSAELLSFIGLLFREHEQWADLPSPDIKTSREEWLARRTAIFGMLDSESVRHLGVLTQAPAGTVVHTRAAALVRRLTTALSVRDRIFVNSLRPASNERTESIAAHIEWLALTISGAFDSLALTVNDHLGADGLPRISVSWTNRDWRNVAKAHCEGLIHVVQDRSILNYLNLCGYLRNTIHDIPPAEFMGNHPGSSGDRLYISIPPIVADKCKKNANTLGLPSDSGLVDAFMDTSFDPALLADRLVDVGLGKLNVLLGSMPWEQFGSSEGSLPPPGTDPMYSKESGEFAKACFGLGLKPREADSPGARRARDRRARKRRAQAFERAVPTSGSLNVDGKPGNE
jgi:hypothetical protein